MPTESDFQPNPSYLSSDLATLFPSSVVVAELRRPADAALLLPAERGLIKRFALKRAVEFTGGRLCARRALSELGIHSFSLHVSNCGAPIWPSGTTGSITHTEGICIAAVARLKHIASLGIDCEIIGAIAEDLWPTICVSPELDWIRALPRLQQPAAITLMFSAKEALYKCQFSLCREWLDFHDLEISVESWNAPHGSICIETTRRVSLAEHARMPMRGKYTIRDQFVVAGVALVAQGS